MGSLASTSFPLILILSPAPSPPSVPLHPSLLALPCLALPCPALPCPALHCPALPCLPCFFTPLRLLLCPLPPLEPPLPPPAAGGSAQIAPLSGTMTSTAPRGTPCPASQSTGARVTAGQGRRKGGREEGRWMCTSGHRVKGEGVGALAVGRGESSGGL